MRLILLVLFMLFSLAGCGGSSSKVVDLQTTQSRVASNPTAKDNNQSNTPPTIYLVGSSTIEINLGGLFEDPSVIAIDAEDGNLTEEVEISNNLNTSHEGTYTIIYSVNDSQGATAEVSRTVKVKSYNIDTPATNLNDVKRLFSASKAGEISKLTYIVVGDSTRAISNTNNSQLYFENLNNRLSKFPVNAVLMARGSHELKQFLEGSEYPTIDGVIATIPNSGESTIIDFSLGVNDFFELNEERIAKNLGGFRENRAWFKQVIKDRLVESVDKIQMAKPEATIMLVTPNPLKQWEDVTHLMVEIYKEVAYEKNLPLANFVNDKMENGNSTEDGEFDDWYRDGIHFSDKALNILSEYILGKILPN